MAKKTRIGRQSFVATFVAALVTALALALAFGSQASAQLPAICEQYPDNEVCVDPGDGGGDEGPGFDGGPSAGAGDGDGSLPFTGYPLTSLILLLLALLITGLTLRAYAAVRDRLRDGPATG